MFKTQLVLAVLCSAPLLVAAQAQAAAAYTPIRGACPANFALVRSAGAPSGQTLSAGESAYIASRKSKALPAAWKAYLANVQATNTALPSYVSNILGGSSAETPTLGLATSGGGYRAAIFGAGVLNALDARNATAAHAGTGGLLQAASYLAGLSGGSWLVSSFAQADFPTISELVFGPASVGTADSFGGWLAQLDLLTPGGSEANDMLYIETLIAETLGKYEAGFAVTFNDVWARALSRHFANGTTAANFFDTNLTHGAGLTFSSVAGVSSFTSYEAPFPLIISDLSSPNENASNTITGDEIPLTNPLFEFNVYEMGSFDPILASFTPTKYLGTASNSSTCVTNYDQLSFVAGTSSELFNEYNVSQAALLNSSIGPVITALNKTIPQPGVELVVARYPNAFYGVAPKTFIDSSEEYLSLVDGGEDGEVIPIQPLLVKARGVDVIVAIDATDDMNDWADGSSLIATQDRTSLFPTAYSFPPIPTTIAEFTSQNLSTRPTFFGCASAVGTPLLIYLANGAPPRSGAPPATNTSTSQSSYTAEELQAALDQTFVVATQGLPTAANETVDAEWPACLACAVVDRARAREGVERAGVCESCFSRYCWDGTA